MTKTYVIPAMAIKTKRPVVTECVPSGVRGLIVTRNAGGADIWNVTHKPSGFIVVGDFISQALAVDAAKRLGNLPIHWNADARTVFADASILNDDDVRAFTRIRSVETKDCDSWRKAVAKKLLDPTFPRCNGVTK